MTDTQQTLGSAYAAVADAVAGLDEAALSVEARPADPDAENRLDEAIAKAIAVLTGNAETILGALLVAAQVERNTNAMGVSAIEHATRTRRGSLH